MNTNCILVMLLVFIHYAAGELLQVSPTPINMTRVLRNITGTTITACYMECEREKGCQSIAVTEGAANQLPTCHLLKKDNGQYDKGIVMTTLQAERKEIKEYALQKPSIQSSTYCKDCGAFQANDGKLGTVATTIKGYDYWEVDLQAYIWITEIRLIMAQYMFDKGQITDLYLYTRENTNDPKDRLCKEIGTPSSIYITVTCDTFTKARFVRLKKNMKRIMVITDVKVFGYEE